MDWPEAVDQLVARTRHERYRDLCDGSHPDHALWRSKVVELATGEAPAPQYPPLGRQAASLAGSLWSWAVSGFAVAPEPLQASRRAVCRSCPRYDAAASRCALCGCYTAAKIAMRSEHCPEGRW